MRSALLEVSAAAALEDASNMVVQKAVYSALVTESRILLYGCIITHVWMTLTSPDDKDRVNSRQQTQLWEG